MKYQTAEEVMQISNKDSVLKEEINEEKMDLGEKLMIPVKYEEETREGIILFV